MTIQGRFFPSIRRAIAICIAIGMWIALSGDSPTEAQPPSRNVSPLPIVVSRQDLPRGFLLTSENISGPSKVVDIAYWPEKFLFDYSMYFSDPSELVGLIVRTDIPRGTPIMFNQLVNSKEDLPAIGSDLALSIFNTEYAVPIRFSAIRTMPEDIQLYEHVSIMGGFNFGLGKFVTVQIVEDAVIIENEPGEPVITIALDDYTQVAVLIWAQDNNTPLTLVRLLE